MSDEEKDKEEDEDEEEEEEKSEENEDDGFFVGHGVLGKDELHAGMNHMFTIKRFPPFFRGRNMSGHFFLGCGNQVCIRTSQNKLLTSKQPPA